MQITINGESIELAETRLADVIEALGYAEKKIAVAVNEIFVPKPQWGSCEIDAGDRIDVLSAIQGG